MTTELKTIRLIVAGGRTFDNFGMMSNAITNFIQRHPGNYVIVSGTARGADKLGERFGIENNLPVERYPADWNKYGKSAGYKRNKVMADAADACICFWDGASKGTQHMISLAKETGLKCLTVTY